MIKKMFKLFSTALLLVVITSCASTGFGKNVATIEKYDDAMFWEINGVDKNGEPSKLYVLGTIHVGDDRLYPLPDFVINSFLESDKLVSELSSEDWENLVPQTVALQVKSAQNEAAYIAETGKTLLDELSENEIKFLLSVLGNMEMVNAMASFEPWVLTSALGVIPLQLSKLGDPSKGVDSNLIAEAKILGKSVDGLDTIQDQFDVITFGDRETQIMMLHDLLKEYMDGLQSCVQEFTDLYEYYLAADEEGLTKMLVLDEKDEESEYAEEYYKVLYLDRNEAWAVKFADYLAEGGTTFIFAGTAHFIGEDSVFNMMKNNRTLK